MSTTILRLITAQQNGGTIEPWVVNNVIDSLASLGPDIISDPNKEYLDLYNDEIETPFLLAEEVHYKEELVLFLAENSVPDFLEKAAGRFWEAVHRAELYLHTGAREKLIRKCLIALIKEHGELIWDCFNNLLDSNNYEDVRRMYFLSQVPEGLEPLKKRFEAHVTKAGLASVSKLVDEAGSDVDSPVPQAYIDALSEVYERNSNIVNRSFERHSQFSASLDKACQ